MKYYNLKDKVVIITGASQGIGKAISIKMAECGANTILVSRSSESLNKVKNIIISKGSNVLTYVTDVSELTSFTKVVKDTLTKWGKIDVLINNAGITSDNIIFRMSEKQWTDVIDTNLKGCFNGIKSVARSMMKNKGGSIINITSVIGQIGNSGQCNYAASKAGIIGLTKSMSKELGSRNIRVNAIAPGYIDTNMTSQLTNEIKNNIHSSIPLGRFGLPDDVANLVCFLASNKSEYITGQTINVDGGMVTI